jgi:hypothetical protein
MPWQSLEMRWWMVSVLCLRRLGILHGHLRDPDRSPWLHIVTRASKDELSFYALLPFCTRTKIQQTIWSAGNNFVLPWLLFFGKGSSRKPSPSTQILRNRVSTQILNGGNPLQGLLAYKVSHGIASQSHTCQPSWISMWQSYFLLVSTLSHKPQYRFIMGVKHVTMLVLPFLDVPTLPCGYTTGAPLLLHRRRRRVAYCIYETRTFLRKQLLTLPRFLILKSLVSSPAASSLK